MRIEHEERLESDPWEDAITDWLATRARHSACSEPASVTMDEVLGQALGLKTQSKNPQVTRRVNRLLAGMGFARKRRSDPAARLRLCAGCGVRPTVPTVPLPRS